jgi:hypothetical protein
MQGYDGLKCDAAWPVMGAAGWGNGGARDRRRRRAAVGLRLAGYGRGVVWAVVWGAAHGGLALIPFSALTWLFVAE